MFKMKTLACSFCGKTAAEVAKLVAGPRVYICDACASEVARIMNDWHAGSRSTVRPVKLPPWCTSDRPPLPHELAGSGGAPPNNRWRGS